MANKRWINLFLIGAIIISILNTRAQAQQLLNAHAIGGMAYTSGSMGADDSGCIYVVARHSFALDVDPYQGVHLLPDSGGGDIFLAKYSSDYHLIWAKGFPAGGSQTYRDIVVGKDGYVYIAGSFEGSIDFELGNSSATLSNNHNNHHDGFVCKFDTSGNFIWAKKIVGTWSFTLDKLALDSHFNIYIGGSFRDTIVINPGPAEGKISTRLLDTDAFIVKLDRGGNYVWGLHYGNLENDRITDLQINNNQLHITGSFKGTCNFDPGPGVSTLQSSYDPSLYILALDLNGIFKWVKGIGLHAPITVQDLFVSSESQIYVTGYFSNTCDLDPGPGNASITASFQDLFLACYDSLGNYKWGFNLGGNFREYGQLIVRDQLGYLYLVGFSKSTSIDMDPSNTGSTIFSGSSQNHIFFISKYTSDGNFISAMDFHTTDGMSAKMLHVKGNMDILFTGNMYGPIDFEPGPGITYLDSIGTQNIFLTSFAQCTSLVVGMDTSEVKVCIGDSILIGDKYYSFEGTYSDTVLSSLGCDSLAVFNILIDSIDYTTIFDTICPNTSYSFGTQMIDTPGSYTATFPSQFGCDSVVNLHLAKSIIDTSIVRLDSALIASEINASYNWIDCITGQTIGQSKVLYPSISGIYAVIISKDGCTDTSSCYNLDLKTSLSNTNEPLLSDMYPNPVSDFLILEVQSIKPISIELLDIYGNVLSFDKFQKKRYSIDVSSFPQGIYFIYMETEKGRRVYKFNKVD